MSRLTGHALQVRLDGRPVLNGVDITVEPATLTGLIGPNGAGKTTLLRALAGLQTPTAGTVMLDGVPLAEMGLPARARRIGYLAQGSELYWPLTVARLVALGRLPHLGPWQRPGPRDVAAIEQAMTACEITGLADRSAGSLSGGERARVLLARALAAEPDLLLADEPVAGLDPYHQLHVMELLRTLAEGGAGTMVVLHDLGLAARFCARLALMSGGRIVAFGPPETVLDPSLLERVYGVRMIVGEVGGEPVLLPWRRPGPDVAVAP